MKLRKRKQYQLIQLNRLAPEKPAEGAPCNGCGVCCAAETCPIGIIVFRQIKGPCRALYWHAEQRRYACGLLLLPKRYFRFLPDCLEAKIRTWIAKRISVGSGCDSHCDVERSE